MKKQKGFTLIEMMIVVAIIGMLATLIIVSVTSALKKAKNEAMKTDAQNIATNLNLYYSKNMEYPDPAAPPAGDGGLDALVPAYMSELPKQDDGTTDYVYEGGGQNCKIKYTEVDGVTVQEVPCK